MSEARVTRPCSCSLLFAAAMWVALHRDQINLAWLEASLGSHGSAVT
jgi:hypothetical protein